MRSTKSLGRIIGCLLFVQIVGLILPFVLLLPITGKPPEDPGYLAVVGFQIKLAVFLLFLNCSLTIGISFAAFRMFRQHGERLALLLVALSVVMFVMQAVDNIQIMALLSFGQIFSETGRPDDLFRLGATVVTSIRRWAHYSEIISIDSWIFLFYVILFRFQVVPRPVAIFGLATVLLHFFGIIVPVWFGVPGVTLMGAAMGLGHLVTAGWLVINGFREAVPRGATGSAG